jgi:hypothetical protein
VTHRRRVLYVPPDSWIVVDDFRGSGEHTFDFHYHFAPDVEVSGMEQDETGVLVRAEEAGMLLRLVAPQPVTSAELIGGWASRAYGEKKPCATLRATLTGPAPTAAMTFILPHGPCPPVVRRLKVESGSGIACSYEHDGFQDIAALSTGDAEMTVADFRMRGEFFWVRLEGGVLKHVLAVRACALDRGNLSIFRLSQPGFVNAPPQTLLGVSNPVHRAA